MSIERAIRLNDPIEYYYSLETINSNTIHGIEADLVGFKLPRECCIIVTGSDGKKERHRLSLTELAIWSNNTRLKIEDVSRLRSGLKRHLAENSTNQYDFSPSGYPDFIFIQSNLPLSYAFGDSKSVYPDRILNSIIVAGDEQTFVKGRARVLQEISGQDETSQRIRRHMKDQLKVYRQAIKKEHFRKVRIFDSTTGYQYYDEVSKEVYGDVNTQRCLGFKLPFLRSTQRTLDCLVPKLLRNLNLSEVAESLPTSTLERLSFYEQVGAIDMETKRAVSEAYAWFLREYHRAQTLYEKERKRVDVSFDLSDFKRHKEIIKTFTYIR